MLFSNLILYVIFTCLLLDTFKMLTFEYFFSQNFFMGYMTLTYTVKKFPVLSRAYLSGVVNRKLIVIEQLKLLI